MGLAAQMRRLTHAAARRPRSARVAVRGCGTHMVEVSERSEPTRRTSCPICGKPVVERLRPFCSRRCADVDLNRWLSGVYAAPVVEDEDEDGQASEQRGQDAT
jgi:endogenous inhibitor of DNA gyrase (YacG/DUF329 family)